MLLKVFLILYSLILGVSLEECTTPNGEKSHCISLLSCPILIMTLAAGHPISTEFYRKSICKNGSEPTVCCGTSGNFTIPKVNARIDSSPHKKINKESLLPNINICGQQHSDDYIINNDTCYGHPTKQNASLLHEYPWIAGLMYSDEGEKYLGCSGALISNRYVMTTADCVFRKPTTVRLGDYNTNEDNDCVHDGQFDECSEPIVEVGVEKVIVRTRSAGEDSVNNLALIRLNHTIQYSDYVRPICIMHHEFAVLGELVIQSGWDSVEVKKKSIAVKIPEEACNIYYVDHHTRPYIDDVCTMLVVPNGYFFCFSTFGGPVMTFRNNRWHLQGLTRFSGRCGHRDTGLGVYSSISYESRSWILDSIEP